MSAFRCVMLPVWAVSATTLCLWGWVASAVGSVLWWAVLISQQDFDRLRTAKVTLRCLSQEQQQ